MRPAPALASLTFLALAASAGVEAQTGATVYTDGRVVVRRTFLARLATGLTTVTLSTPAGDPSSLFPLDPGVSVAGLEYPGLESDAALLSRALGRTLAFRVGDDSVVGVLRSADPFRLELANGRIVTAYPGRLETPRDLLVIPDSVTVTFQSDRARDRVRVGYEAAGATWRAGYAIRLGARGARISGRAVIWNEALALDSVELTAFAGQIGQPPLPRPRVLTRSPYRLEEIVTSGVQSGDLLSSRVPAAVAETAGTHRSYVLPGRHRLTPGRTLVIPLFVPIEARVERIHVVEAATPVVTGLIQTNQAFPVDIQYRADRTAGTEFGDQPLPPGVVSIYQGGPERETLVGVGRITHIPVNQPFVVAAGRASEVKASRTSPQAQAVQDSIMNPNGSMSVRASAWIQPVEWTLINGTDSSLVVEVSERRPGRWRVLRPSSPVDTTESDRARFRVTVPGRGEAKLTYVVRAEQP